MIKETNKIAIEDFLKKYFKQYKTTNDPFEKIYIYEEKTIIGVISVSVIYERAEINYIAVKEANRRQGIGSKLLNYVFKLLKNQGVATISLEVDCTNEKAIAFYKKNGFLIETIRKNYYGKNDGYLMIKKLRWAYE